MDNNIFGDLLGEIYNYSLIKYMTGTAKIFTEKEFYEVKWELCLDISGKTHFQISYGGFPLEEAAHFSLEGETDDKKWIIKSPKIYVENIIFDAKNYYDDSTYICSATCMPLEINFTKKDSELNISKAEVFISNFDFVGSKDKMSTLDTINIQLQSTKIKMILIENQKKIKDLLKTKRISSAILSKFFISPNYQITFEKLNDEITKVTDFLSSISLNTNYAKQINYFNETELVAFTLRNTLQLNYHSNVLIDNFIINNGIERAFEKMFEEFHRLKEPLRLNRYVHRIISIESQEFIENKLVQLIIAYEALLTDYLIYIGLPHSEVYNMNIQQKLGKINKELRFIPKELLGDKLREMRNPLFHTGVIPQLDSEEQYIIYENYYSLLKKIYLKILSYNDEFLSKVSF